MRNTPDAHRRLAPGRLLFFAGMVLATWTILGADGVCAVELNENCTVSVLNRTAQVRPDGTWVLPNVPASLGSVRARATCVVDGVTSTGQSDFFTIPEDGSVDVPPILFGEDAPVPARVEIFSEDPTIRVEGGTLQLLVTLHFADGSTQDGTASSTGTNYTSSNSAIATVDSEGLVTGHMSGSVLITALNEGALWLIQVLVLVSGDMDGDGIPDDLELANGLDPSNPVDAFLDPDGDGLTNFEELVQFGTRPDSADSDGDGLTDDEELEPGEDGFVTNPLLADTDGDGVPDGTEGNAGTDPTDPNSVDLAGLLVSVEVTPSIFALTVNGVLGEASIPLTVTGTLTDGSVVDLTSTSRGTNYVSDNLSVCSFGAEDGRIFAGYDGVCTITVTNAGLAAIATGGVRTFNPTPLGFVPVAGFANSVDIFGDLAYVASGGSGIQVVDVSNRAAPQLVSSIATPGNANDVKAVAGRLYLADGSAGIAVYDLADQSAPAFLGGIDTPDDARDLAVRD